MVVIGSLSMVGDGGGCGRGVTNAHIVLTFYYRGGPTPFLYMATRFLPNVHVQKCTKYVFSCLEVPWILAVANLQ